MAEKQIDLDALVAAVDAQRKAKDLSWRQVAGEADVSPSTLTRMQQGKLPDVNTFSALVQWLRIPAERFMVQGQQTHRRSADPMAVASTLLRGKREVSPRAAKAFEELVQAAFKLVKELK
jgi:transcriptional regulator with XRE-family HTH domain